MGLKNNVTDADLIKLVPDLADHRWSSQTDYSTQIAEAFAIMKTDLAQAGVDVNQIPGEVIASQTDGAGTIGETTMTVTDASAFTEGRAVRISEGDFVEYQQISTISSNTITFTDTLANTYTSATVEEGWVEDAFDRPLAELALYLIFRVMIREPGDRWELLADQFKADYTNHLASAVFSYDADRSRYITLGETHTQATTRSVEIRR